MPSFYADDDWLLESGHFDRGSVTEGLPTEVASPTPTHDKESDTEDSLANESHTISPDRGSNTMEPEPEPSGDSPTSTPDSTPSSSPCSSPPLSPDPNSVLVPHLRRSERPRFPPVKL